jgi:hypothetical protein
MRCALGQTWDGKTCRGKAHAYTWDEAIVINHNYADYIDWCLPSIAELKSILDSSRSNPAINTSAFPETPSAYFWSSTSASKSMAWGLDFNSKVSNTGNHGFNNHVRLVRREKPVEKTEIHPLLNNPEKTISATANIDNTKAPTQTPAKQPPASINTPRTSDVSESIHNIINRIDILENRFHAAINRIESAFPLLAATQSETLSAIKKLESPEDSHIVKLVDGLSSSIKNFEKRLDYLEKQNSAAINRIEAALAPLPTNQLETLTSINKVQSLSNVNTDKLDDEIKALRQLIERQETKFNTSISGIEMLLKSVSQNQAAAWAAITQMQQTPAANNEILASEIAELRQMIVKALSSSQSISQTIPPQTTHLESIPHRLNSMASFLAWLVDQEVVSLSNLRTRLLPLDLFPSAVIDDINERALDLTGEITLEEEGDNVIVRREVLLQVVAAWTE